MIKYLCANSAVPSIYVVLPESPSDMCSRFFTDTGVIGIGGSQSVQLEQHRAPLGDVGRKGTASISGIVKDEK